MTEPNTAPPAAAAAADGTSDSLPARLVGVLFSPQATFARIVARPRWFGALLVVTLVTCGLMFGLLSTESGQTAMLDQQVRQSEAFGQTINEQQYAQMERMLPMMRYFVPASQLVMIPIVTMVVAGILFAVFNAMLGGTASFKQVAAVVTHSGAVTLLQQMFIAPLNYARESMSSATNLGVFVPFLDEGHFVARFLGIIDLFIVWWLLVLAIGLAVLYRRRTSPIFWSFMGLYVIIALVIAIAIRGASGGA
jgi:hypothetical protein